MSGEDGLPGVCGLLVEATGVIERVLLLIQKGNGTCSHGSRIHEERKSKPQGAATFHLLFATFVSWANPSHLANSFKEK